MQVSVVIPAYNQAEYLRLALSSALAQTHRDLEVIVIDDGSSDHTASTVRSFADPRVRYVWQANDGTFGLGARNRGMLDARGDWIALLDQDDLWHPEKLSRQLAFASENKDVACVFCLTNFINEQGRITGRQSADIKAGSVYAHLLRGNTYYASTGIFRRSLLAKAGLPHESSGYADWQLWLSLSRHARTGVVREYLANYRIHAASFQQAQIARRSLSYASDNWRTLAAQRCRLPDQDPEAARSYRRGMRINSRLFYEAACLAAEHREAASFLEAWRRAFECAPFYRGLPWIIIRDAIVFSWKWLRPTR